MSFTYRWVVPDDIDYEGFNFSWRPDPLDPPYIHQFGTQWQKSGGPALVVGEATEIKYRDEQRVKKLPCKQNWFTPVDLVDWDYSWHPDDTDPPYIHQFSTQWNRNAGPQYIVPGARIKKFHDTPLAIAAPCKQNWTTNYKITDWDYSWHPDPREPDYIYAWGSSLYPVEREPVIKYAVPGAIQIKYMTDRIAQVQEELDVIFVSAGEKDEHIRFNRLQELTSNRTRWVHGVRGRENALKQAAQISTTEWFFCFPGKLFADQTFDFSWFPRKSQGPKHYIFYARNPVNGLIYGHQAAVCYHRDLVLNTENYGLDFTMSAPHDIVPVISGTAQFDLDPLITWRTAFREAVKLQAALDSGDQESADRLQVWLNVGEGSAGILSKHGAKQGVEFYQSVNGNIDELTASWDWEWLQKRYDTLDKTKIL